MATRHPNGPVGISARAVAAAAAAAALRRPVVVRAKALGGGDAAVLVARLAGGLALLAEARAVLQQADNRLGPLPDVETDVVVLVVDVLKLVEGPDGIQVVVGVVNHPLRSVLEQVLKQQQCCARARPGWVE